MGDSEGQQEWGYSTHNRGRGPTLCTLSPAELLKHLTAPYLKDCIFYSLQMWFGLKRLVHCVWEGWILIAAHVWSEWIPFVGLVLNFYLFTAFPPELVSHALSLPLLQPFFFHSYKNTAVNLSPLSTSQLFPLYIIVCPTECSERYVLGQDCNKGKQTWDETE